LPNQRISEANQMTLAKSLEDVTRFGCDSAIGGHAREQSQQFSDSIRFTLPRPVRDFGRTDSAVEKRGGLDQQRLELPSDNRISATQ
jgi:hypothetical protein